MNGTVSIIIINWNGWKDTIECLESLYRIEYPDYNVILIDNDSKDESLSKIELYCEGKIPVESKFFRYSTANKPITIKSYTSKEISSEKTAPETFNAQGDVSGKSNHSEEDDLNLPPNKRLILIKNDANYGFAEGNNIGIRYAIETLKSDYVLLLNNDTVVDPLFLKRLMEKISEEPSIGFVGPKTYFYDFEGKNNVLTFAGGSLNLNKGMSQSTGFGEVDHGQYDEIKTVEYVEGSCILTKREVLEKIGFLDPKYFAYWEETDLCIRGKNEGYSSVFVPEAVIWHKVSSSVPNPTMIYYMNRNMFWFMKKYAKRKEFLTFILYFFCYKFWNMNFRYFYNSIYKVEFNDNKAFIRGVKDGLFH